MSPLLQPGADALLDRIVDAVVEQEGEDEGGAHPHDPQDPAPGLGQTQPVRRGLGQTEPADADHFVGNEHGEGDDRRLFDQLGRLRDRDGARGQDDDRDQGQRNQGVLVEILHHRQTDGGQQQGPAGGARLDPDALREPGQSHAQDEQGQGAPDAEVQRHLIDGIVEDGPAQFIGRQIADHHQPQRQPRPDPRQSAQHPGKGQVAAQQGRDRPTGRVPAQTAIDAERLHQGRLRRQLIPGEPFGVGRRQADGRAQQHHGHQQAQHDQMGRKHPQRPLQEEVGLRHPAACDRGAIDPHQHIAAVDQEEVGQQEAAPLEHRMHALGQRNGRRGLEVMQDDQRRHDEPQRVQPPPAHDRRRLIVRRKHAPAHDEASFGARLARRGPVSSVFSPYGRRQLKQPEA
ncbi:hypothetical protein D3C71_1297060 [compost metagenome]